MRLVARIGMALFGVFALIWAALVFPVFLQRHKPTAVAGALERGENYGMAALMPYVNAAPQADPLGFCDALARRANMIIQTKVLEDPMVAENRTLQDAAWHKAHSATRALLACSPADSLGWLILFWLNMTKNGYSAEYGNFLQLSYDASPNEAAVALWRNRIVLGLDDRVPAKFTDLAVVEFVKLVNSERFYQEMGDVFERAPPALQRRLALALKTAEPKARQVFARMMTDRGVRANIPDAEPARERPWN